VLFPQREEQLNLPARPRDHERLLKGQHRLGRIGDEQGPLRERKPMRAHLLSLSLRRCAQATPALGRHRVWHTES
jgi:hypothetical protein